MYSLSKLKIANHYGLLVGLQCALFPIPFPSLKSTLMTETKLSNTVKNPASWVT